MTHLTVSFFYYYILIEDEEKTNLVMIESYMKTKTMNPLRKCNWDNLRNGTSMSSDWHLALESCEFWCLRGVSFSKADESTNYLQNRLIIYTVLGHSKKMKTTMTLVCPSNKQKSWDKRTEFTNDESNKTYDNLYETKIRRCI